jgi:hypothetical protein
MSFTFHQPFGPGIYQSKVSDELVKFLLETGKATKFDPTSDNRANLASNFMKGAANHYRTVLTLNEIQRVDQELRRHLDVFFEECGNRLMLPKDIFAQDNFNIDNFWLKDMWVNFQLSGDFNPLHQHGGDISFVIYLQMPRQEDLLMPVTNIHPNAGIQWRYGEYLPFCKEDFHRMPEVGDIFIFSAKVRHQVHAFWHKDPNFERVSVSGNYWYSPPPAD